MRQAVIEIDQHSDPTSAWSTAPADYPVRMMSRLDGLPSAQVQGMTIDAAGMKWFAGPNGLTRFDGTRTQVFTQRHGLTTHGLRTVAAAPDGAIWIGSDVGVDVIRDGLVEAMPGGWPWGLTNSIVAERSGRVWFGAALGLITYQPGRGFHAESDPRLAGAMAQVVALDDRGAVWVISRRSGLLRCDRETWLVVAGDTGSVGALLTLAPGPGGSMFVGGEHGVVQVDADGVSQGRIDTEPGPVTAVWANDQELWLGVGTEVRHHRWVDGAWVFVRTLGFTSRINRLGADDEGNVWAATDTLGMAKIEFVRRLMSRPRLDIGAVFSVRPTRSGSHLVAGDRGAARVRFGDAVGNAETTFSPIATLEGLHAWDLIEDESGELWAATQTGLQRHRADGTVERIGTDHAVLGAPARALLERNDGLWVGTLNGLCVVNGDNIDVKLSTGDEPGKSLGYVYSLVPSGRSVWIGTLGNGLWHDRGAGPLRILGDGLTRTGNTYGIAVQGDGSVAVSQDNRIVVIHPDGKPRVVTEVDDGLAGWAVVWGDDATLWVGSSTGLCHYSTRNNELLQNITLWMGRNGWEFTTSRSLLPLDEGRMLCGLDSGLTIVDIAQVEALAVQRPEVILSSLTWTNTTPESVDDVLMVNEGKWFLDVEVSSMWSVYEAHRHFRFRLLGFEPNWSETSESTTVRHSSLPVGNYTLQAQAHSPLSGWGPVASLATVQVNATDWHARWEQVVSAGGRRRLRKLRQESHLLEQRVRERTVELSKATEQLTMAHARERQFSADVSHQLRTPLAALRLRLERAQRNSGSEELSSALLDVDHLTETVHYLLSNARDARPKANAVRLDQAADRAVQRWRDVATTMGRVVQVLPGDSVSVLGSQTGIDQILDVLLENSLSHGTGVVTVFARSLGGGGAIDVGDEGNALSTDDVPRIFHRGVGLGTGMGLALARALAEADGGRLVVKSRNPTMFSLIMLEQKADLTGS